MTTMGGGGRIIEIAQKEIMIVFYALDRIINRLQLKQ
jgi:hypothetical protein